MPQAAARPTRPRLWPRPPTGAQRPITHRIDKLETRGLVKRRSSKEDGRVVLARLTAKGEAGRQGGRAGIEAAGEVASALSKAERAPNWLLGKLLESLIPAARMTLTPGRTGTALARDCTPPCLPLRRGRATLTGWSRSPRSPSPARAGNLPRSGAWVPGCTRCLALGRAPARHGPE